MIYVRYLTYLSVQPVRPRADVAKPQQVTWTRGLTPTPQPHTHPNHPHKPMDAFIRRQPLPPPPPSPPQTQPPKEPHETDPESTDTDLKLALLTSLFPTLATGTLLELLVSADGSVDAVRASLSAPRGNGKRALTAIGHQTSLASFRGGADAGGEGGKRRALTRKGQTLHLYAPEDVAAHTPCSIIHDFLPAREADDLLRELLGEARTFERQTFKMFDNVVQSPHSACFYVDSLEEMKRQKTEFLYNGSYLEVCLPIGSLKSAVQDTGC